MPTQRAPRPIRRRVLASFALLAVLGAIAAIALPNPAGAAGSPSLERMLAWVERNNDFDDEFRADLVIRVPAGERPTLVRYDWNLDGSLDTTATLASGAGTGTEYQIVSVTSDGADDLIALTVRGDADYDATCANQPQVRDNRLAITVPSGVIDISGFTTTIQESDPCNPGTTTRPVVRTPWDNVWNSPDGNSQDGWGAIVTGNNEPANKQIIDADNSNTSFPANCGITDAVSYQWYKETSAGIFSPVGALVTTAVTPHKNNVANAISLPAQSFPGAGYYKLLAWPNAKSSAGGADCTTRTFTPGNTSEAFVVGTVFNDFVPTAGAPAAHPVALVLASLGAAVYGASLVVRRTGRRPVQQI